MTNHPVRVVDQSVRERALVVTESFIVQAPAGSGKTELLIQRYLNLLAHVRQPEAVLAITFTRKAAAEMRHRIMQALQQADQSSVDVDKLSTHERLTLQLASSALQQSDKHHWQLQAQPARLRIMTIDSFNASLVRRMPWLSKTGADVRLEHQPKALYEEAAWKLLGLSCNLSGASEETQQALRILLLHLDNNDRRVARLLVSLLQRRDQWLRYLVPLKGERQLKQQLTQMFQHVITEQLAHLKAMIPDQLGREMVRLAAFSAETLHGAGETQHSVMVLRNQINLPDSGYESLKAWQALAALYLKKASRPDWRQKFTVKEGFPRGCPEKEDLTALMQQLHRQHGLLEAMAEVRYMPVEVYEPQQWLLLEALIELLPVLVAHLRLVFQHHSAMDFIEQSLAAQSALERADGEITDLALKLDYQLQHILMDEFQDTSRSQLKLLETLVTSWQPGDGRSLFLVGDPMQSIYRFREADVSGFLSVRDHGIASIRPESLVLETNFRSTPGLIQWFNDVFPDVLASKDDLSLGAVSYSPATAAGTEDDGRGVFVHPVLNDTQRTNGETEAANITGIIQQLLTNEPAQSIGILVRSRAHLRQLFPTLQGAGIDFQAIEILPLANRPVIQDLLTVTRTLLHRHDRAAWLAVLRAPWCGLTLDSLYRLTNQHDEDVSRQNDIWTLMNRAVSEAMLTGGEHDRLKRMVDCYTPILNQSHLMDIRTQVDWLWRALGGAACYATPQDDEDKLIYLDLIERLAQSDKPGGGTLTINTVKNALDEAYSSGASYHGAAVQLMTIHKSKGLEFDAVILPALEKGTRADQKKLLAWHEELGGDYVPRLLLAPIHAPGSDDQSFDFVRSREKRRDFYERQRLLYVAATRARKQLHLCGALNVDDDGKPGSPASGSFLEMLEPHIRQHYVDYAQQQTIIEDNNPDEDDEEGSIYLKRVAAGWQPTKLGRNIQWEREQAPQPERAHIEFSWAGQAARIVGTVTHQYLYIIGEQGLSAWNRERISQQHAVIRNNLVSAGLPQESLDAAVSKVMQALENLIVDDRACWILGEHQNVRNEYAISGLLEGRIVNRVIDRTFTDNEGTRWIIDYKTSIHEGGDLEGFLDEEQNRYQEQLNEYAALTTSSIDETVRLGLYFPLVKGWREWQI